MIVLQLKFQWPAGQAFFFTKPSLKFYLSLPSGLPLVSNTAVSCPILLNLWLHLSLSPSLCHQFPHAIWLCHKEHGGVMTFFSDKLPVGLGVWLDAWRQIVSKGCRRVLHNLLMYFATALNAVNELVSQSLLFCVSESRFFLPLRCFRDEIGRYSSKWRGNLYVPGRFQYYRHHVKIIRERRWCRGCTS